MGCMESALSNLFPTSWLDPYGNMPLNDKHSVQIDITQVQTDDGIRVTAVKTPPRASTTSIQDAISMALGLCDECEKPMESGKETSGNDESGKMEAANHRSFDDTANKDRNLGEGGSEDSAHPGTGKPDKPDTDDTKKKTPWK